MYYAYDLFVKKGPLAKLWLAGTYHRKLTKAQCLSSDLKTLCKNVEAPPTPLALPTQSTLLRGVCRIEQKCVGYLLGDAIDAKTKLFVKESGTNTNVDLPQNQRTARYDTITYPDTFAAMTMDELMSDSNDVYDLYAGDEDYASLDMSRQTEIYNQRSEEQHRLYQANPEDITLEDQSSLNLDILGDSDLASMHRDSYAQDLDFNIQDDILQAENPEDQAMLSSDIDQLNMDEFGSQPEVTASDFGLSDEIVEDQARQGRKRKRYQIQIDTNTELSDEVIIKGLQSTLDILITRPVLTDKPKDPRQALDISLRQPSFLPMKYLAPELVETFKRCADSYNKPVPQEEPQYDGDVPYDQEGDHNLFDNVDMQRSEYESDSRFHSDAEIGRDGRDPETESVYSDGASVFGVLDDTSDNARRRNSTRDSLMIFDETGYSSEPGSPNDGSRSGSHTPYVMDGVSLLEDTPEFMNSELNLSQIEIPHEEVNPRRLSQSIRQNMKKKPEFSKFTQVFKRMLEKRFDEDDSKKSLDLDGVLRACSEEEKMQYVTRKDFALSFYQTLVLKSLNIIDVEQKQSFGKIKITKGDMWDTELYGAQKRVSVA